MYMYFALVYNTKIVGVSRELAKELQDCSYGTRNLGNLLTSADSLSRRSRVSSPNLDDLVIFCWLSGNPDYPVLKIYVGKGKIQNEINICPMQY